MDKQKEKAHAEKGARALFGLFIKEAKDDNNKSVKKVSKKG